MSGLEQQFFDFTRPAQGEPERPSPGMDGNGTLPPISGAYHPPTPRILSVIEPAPHTVTSIRKALSLGTGQADTVLATILAARGFQSDERLKDFLEPGRMPLPNPSRMKNFDLAVETIADAIRSRHTIGLVGDYDVDGITAIAQATSAFSATRAPHVWHIPNRRIDGYGISDRLVERLIHDGVRLVVLFDHGTHALRQIRALKAAGIASVVFDHHVVGASLPEAILVNPAQPGCGFSEVKPCASGLAFFLTHRLSEIFGTPSPDCGLAALGTIADMVPLHGPNRTMARQGLAALRAGACRGIVHLASQLGLAHAGLSSPDVGFYIGPALNAAGRLDDAARCVELLTSKDEDRLRLLASELVRQNDERKSIQRSQLQHNLARLSNLRRVPTGLVSSHDEHHQGIVGLTAQGLAQRHSRPSFVFAPAENFTLKGSGRAGDPRYDLMSLLNEVQRNDADGIILKVGGHRAAAGLTIKAEGLTTFTTLLARAITNQYGPAISSVEIHADARLTFSSLTPSLVAHIHQRLDPFGQGFEAPRIMFEKVKVIDIQELAGDRRMLVLEQGDKKVRAFIGPELWNDNLWVGSICDIIATPATIYTREKNHVQLSVHGYTTDVGAERPRLAVTNERLTTVAHPVKKPRILIPREVDNAALPPQEGLSDRAILQVLAENARVNLPRDWLYHDLALLAAEEKAPFNGQPFLDAREKFTRDYDLSALKADSFQFRPAQIEFCRYFLDTTANVILQAPTGTGKTEMALIVASRQKSLGHRTIFAAPTIEIARQVSQRAPTMIDLEATLLDGAVSPKKRATIYRTQDPQFISAVPHVVKNDIDSGTFAFRPTDLLVVDEGHHTTGEYPYVPLVEAARAVGARVLLLSATPGQVEPGVSWAKLDALKQLIGVETIFPLNVVRRTLPVSPLHCELTQELKIAINHLAARLAALRSDILQYLEDKGEQALYKEARKHFGGATLTFPSSHSLEPLVATIRTLNNDPDRWKVVSALYASVEISELYQLLAYQGISGFLLRVLEKRFEIAFPKQAARSHGTRKTVAAPQYVRDVYCSREIEKAYNHLARASFVGLLRAQALADISGLPLSGWRALSGKERRSLFNQHVGPVLGRLRQELVELDYSDHPKERAIFHNVLERHPTEQSAVYTRDRSHALFLTARLSHRLQRMNKTAVALTGLGEGVHKGVSRKDRKDNLEKFVRGDALVIVSTSAGNEGIDFPSIQHGYAYRFNSSFIEALQQWGRVGRRDLLGSFRYLCSTPEEHGKVSNIHRKERHFYEKMNSERQRLLDQR